MDPLQQVLAESLINSILTKGIFKELTRRTFITEKIDTTSNTNEIWQSNLSNASPQSSSQAAGPFSGSINYFSDMSQNY